MFVAPDCRHEVLLMCTLSLTLDHRSWVEMGPWRSKWCRVMSFTTRSRPPYSTSNKALTWSGSLLLMVHVQYTGLTAARRWECVSGCKRPDGFGRAACLWTRRGTSSSKSATSRTLLPPQTTQAYKWSHFALSLFTLVVLFWWMEKLDYQSSSWRPVPTQKFWGKKPKNSRVILESCYKDWTGSNVTAWEQSLPSMTWFSLFWF